MPRGWTISLVDLVTLFLKPEVDSVGQLSAFIRSEQILCLEWIADWRLPSPRSCYRAHNSILFVLSCPLTSLNLSVLCLLLPFPIPWYSTAAFYLFSLGIAILLLPRIHFTLGLRGACPSQHRWRKSLFWGTIFAVLYLDASDLSSSP